MVYDGIHKLMFSFSGPEYLFYFSGSLIIFNDKLCYIIMVSCFFYL